MLALLENMDKAILNAQLVDGVVLMILGMATVFVFLIVLIYATKLMSKICMGISGKNKPAEVKKSASPAPKAKATNDAAVAAAIVTAYDKDKN